MTQQIPDPFIWNDTENVLVRAENIYSLFDPEKYGLHPDMQSTACYKGFIISFSVKDGQLYIDTLRVYCRDGAYPVINGITPEKVEENFFSGGMDYKNLNIASQYTGVITIGRHLLDLYRGRAFTGRHSYEVIYDLTFENGLLKKKENVPNPVLEFIKLHGISSRKKDTLLEIPPFLKQKYKK